ncbi:hypothetical protein BT69DRAFT_1330825 [Atractiella rhizophila]|nr:hypothetical protein BT69DRAFT_1330825 [Atractiella rhizophila]
MPVVTTSLPVASDTPRPHPSVLESTTAASKQTISQLTLMANKVGSASLYAPQFYTSPAASILQSCAPFEMPPLPPTIRPNSQTQPINMKSPRSSFSQQSVRAPSPSASSVVSKLDESALLSSRASGSEEEGKDEMDVDASVGAAGSPDSNTEVKEEEGDHLADGDDSKGKGKLVRPLKNTKRAAQNRAAQRAFRERREAYVKELERRSQQLDAYSTREAVLVNRIKELETSIISTLHNLDAYSTREAVLVNRIKELETSIISTTERDVWEDERLRWERKECEWERERGRLLGEVEASKREIESLKRRLTFNASKNSVDKPSSSVSSTSFSPSRLPPLPTMTFPCGPSTPSSLYDIDQRDKKRSRCSIDSTSALYRRASPTNPPPPVNLGASPSLGRRPADDL